MPWQARGAVGYFWVVFGARAAWAGGCPGARAVLGQPEQELGGGCCSAAAKWGCGAGGGSPGLCPPVRGVLPVAGLCSLPPAAGATVTGGAFPHPAAEDSPAAMRWLECRSCRCPPRPRPAASGGGRWPGRCCWGTRGLQGDSGTGGAGMGGRDREGTACGGAVCVCARECACVCVHEHA